ncbi:YxeA family protein [Clostridium perfringens]|uniref:YxeA family protein n=1 Tax=Clostridium perfringens TaxID=1502 RepID=UPI002247AC41|nr:YxeA family protein [Clostridium perfringens]MCX0365435.1 YxeA family protein [Clostridium perfringens]MCX0373530.1 YxeA family protein [Clostridium perfringens]MCX0395029.1 YxeA family protein [Clostridium perfringens]MCX0401186.1 YxeA family protein [Clostridium perfringens]
MKKKNFIISIFMLVFFSLNVLGCIKIREIGTEKYYLKITQDGKLNSNNNYSYENIPAYNKDGEKILVNFWAMDGKQLRKNAYLQVSVKNPSNEHNNEIEGYKEVSEDDLPSKVKNILIEQN